MEKYLRPERFDVNPNSSTANKEWIHWLKTLENFYLSSVSTSDEKLRLLINFISPTVYEYISDSPTYDNAIEVLTSLYVKPKNEIFTRHQLATRKQQPGETLDEFAQALRTLAKDCNFKGVTANIYCDESIRDAFITGLNSSIIRQRLLENKTLTLTLAFDQARSLEFAQKHSEQYQPDVPQINAMRDTRKYVDNQQTSSQISKTCYFCGNNRHPRSICPARDTVCHKCQKKGHFAKVCKSNRLLAVTESDDMSAMISAGAPNCLSHAIRKVEINGHSLTTLIDTGSSDNFINKYIVNKYQIPYIKSSGSVSMASSSLKTKIKGYCKVNMTFQNQKYTDITLSILPDLCADVILGQAFMKQHSNITISFGGKLPPLLVCSLKKSQLSPATLFTNLSKDCHPIATRSRRFSHVDKLFIQTEIKKLLNDKIIEPSKSPWRAQIVITTNERHKKRMCVDCFQTINKFTYLDAYPLPRIDDQVNELSKFHFFSTLDHTSAYHQISLLKEDKPYTAFEANGKLYQFTRLPFGPTNAVAVFQRKIDEFIIENSLQQTYAYLDNITVAGMTQTEHNFNLKKLQSS
jgi:hypothetical protein